MAFILIGLAGVIGGFLLREEKVYKPEYNNIQSNITERDRRERNEGLVPKTDPLMKTVKYQENQVGHTILNVDVEIFIDRNGTRSVETKTFPVEISSTNVLNEKTVLEGQGNKFRDWKRGDIIFKLEKMNQAEILKKNVINKLKICFPTEDDLYYDRMTEVVIHGFDTMDEITLPNKQKMDQPIIFTRNEMLC
jgi:hypothetical protein